MRDELNMKDELDGAGFNWLDLLSLKKLVSPYTFTILYWLSLFLLVTTWLPIIWGATSAGGFFAFLYSLFMAIVSFFFFFLVIRVLFEFVLSVFDIRKQLREINRKSVKSTETIKDA
ncbi:MAG: DUF4282 domain-containing protein [Neisseriaceae bacterium]